MCKLLMFSGIDTTENNGLKLMKLKTYHPKIIDKNSIFKTPLKVEEILDFWRGFTYVVPFKKYIRV